MTTLFGNHTIAELADLLRAKDPLIPVLEKQYNAFHPTWTLTNPTSDAAFSRDLGALKARYWTATAGLHAVVDATSSDNTTSAEAQYTKVLAALQKQSGVTSPGDLQDLWIRLENAIRANEAARGLPPTKLSEPPPSWVQPRADSDWAENRLRGAPPGPKLGQPIDTGWMTPPAPPAPVPPPAPLGEPWPWGKIVAALLGILGVGTILVGRRTSNVARGRSVPAEKNP